MSENATFWRSVADEVDIDAIAIGDAFKVETNGRHFVIMIVEDLWDDPQKGRQIRFRPATIDDEYDVDELVTVVVG